MRGNYDTVSLHGSWGDFVFSAIFVALIRSLHLLLLSFPSRLPFYMCAGPTRVLVPAFGSSSAGSRQPASGALFSDRHGQIGRGPPEKG